MGRFCFHAKAKPMTEHPTHCAGCGVKLPPPSPKANRGRKWCSDQCRKKTLYSPPCIDCGTPTNGTTPSKHKGRCKACGQRHVAEVARAKSEPIDQAVLELRRQGYLNWAIEDKLGLPYNAAASRLCRMRRRGVEVPPSPYWFPAAAQEER